MDRCDSGTTWRRLSGSVVSACRFIMCRHLTPLVTGRLTESVLRWHHNLTIPVKSEVMVPVPVKEKRKT